MNSSKSSSIPTVLETENLPVHIGEVDGDDVDFIVLREPEEPVQFVVEDFLYLVAGLNEC